MWNAQPKTERASAWCLIALLAIGQQAVASAMDQYGRVTFDGLPVPGATITAVQGDATVAATTDADGFYRLVDLAEGVWRLTVEMLGFSTLTRDITVPSEGEPPTWEVTLRSFEDIVRDIPLRFAPFGQNPAPDRVASAPAQDAFQRTGVMPTTETPGVLAALPDATPEDPTGMGFANGLLISGSVNNSASTPFAQPRAFGNARPNQRSLYTYAAGLQLGNSSWDARPFSMTGLPSPRPSYTNTQVLGTFQGPVRLPGIGNAINLFAGYQGSSDTNARSQSARLPTDRERAGDFSQTFDALGQPVQVVDPATGLPFEGNAIPQDRISPQAAALLGYYPHADGDAAGRFNYQAPVLTAARQDSFQSRMAYSIDNRNQLQGSVSHQRTASDSRSLFGFDDSRESGATDAQAIWSRRLSPFMTLRARYQYTRSTNRSMPYFANLVNVSGDAGIRGNNQDPLNWGPPTLSFSSDLAGLTDAQYASSASETHTWAAESSRFRGRHNMIVGGEVRRHLHDVFGQQDPRGTFAFTGAATGVDFADFLLGLPQTSAIGYGNADKYFRGHSYAAYVTDDWRLSPSFTLNVGVRWEYESPITEARGRLANLDVAPDFTAIGRVLPGEVGAVTGTRYSDALVGTDKGGIQPRLGMAWRPLPGSSLVVRAGYGIYRNTNVYQSIATLLAQQPPFSTTFNIGTSAEHPLTLADGFSPAGGTVLNTFAVDPQFQVGFVQNWQASVQRDLPHSLTMAATYLGTKGSRLMQQFLPNTYPDGAEPPCPACPTGFRYLTSGGRSSRHALQVQLRRRLRNGLTSSVEYTLARAMDNAGAFGGASLEGSALAQNWLDLEAEYARSDFDQRHQVTASAEYTTGAGIAGGTLLDGWRGRLLKDWTLTANLNAGSGLPLTPVYFAPVSGTGIVGPVRPDLVGAPDDAPAGYYANPAAFAAPAPGQWGSAKRNSITGPRSFSLNAAVARTFRVGDRLNLDWRIDATNVLNRVTYAGVATLVTSPQFGLPNRAHDMRTLRSSIRMRF